MARRLTTLIIRPSVLETGDEVVRVGSITRAAIGYDPGQTGKAQVAFLLFLIAAGVAGAAGVAYAQPLGAAVFGALSVVALIRALWLIRKRSLYVITGDGRASVLMRSDLDFMRDVLGIINQAMVAGGAESYGTFEIDLQSQQILRHTPTASTAAAVAAEQGDVQRLSTTFNNAPQLHTEPSAHPAIASNAAGDVGSLNGAVNGVTSGHGLAGAGHASHAHHAGLNDTSAAGTATQGAGSLRDQLSAVNGGATGSGGPQPFANGHLNGAGAPPQTSAALARFDAMIDRIGPQYGDRFDDVRAWLAPVRDYLSSGTGDRAEAQARWSIFAKEHVPALKAIPTVADNARAVGEAVGG
ncbi:MAG: hypothetical protein AAFR70_05615 [Pseudomonadota bacterium]